MPPNNPESPRRSTLRACQLAVATHLVLLVACAGAPIAPRASGAPQQIAEPQCTGRYRIAVPNVPGVTDADDTRAILVWHQSLYTAGSAIVLGLVGECGAIAEPNVPAHPAYSPGVLVRGSLCREKNGEFGAIAMWNALGT